jgi:NAD(P)H-dependent FMN reductase
MKFVIVSGSTREGRTTHRVALALQRALQALAHESHIIDLKEAALPPFTERLALLQDKPSQLLAISAKLQAAQAIIFLTPEYNGSISSALKGFIDTFGKGEFAGKPIATATASTGIMGGMRAAQHLQQIILALQAYPQPQMLLTAEVTKQLNEEGEIINPAYQPKLDGFVSAFVKFAEKFSA